MAGLMGDCVALVKFNCEELLLIKSKADVRPSIGYTILGQCFVLSTRHSSDSTAFEAPANLSQHGVSAAGQLVIRFWAVTS